MSHPAAPKDEAHDAVHANIAGAPRRRTCSGWWWASAVLGLTLLQTGKVGAYGITWLAG